MALRLVIGLVKGLIVGGLLGFVLAKVGLAAPGALIAYLAAAAAGALVGLIAGKPIWAEGARIEAGLKAAFGALVGAGLMWLARSFLGVPFPADLGTLTEANQSLGEVAANGTLGGLAITSLALVAGVLGAFYDADNTPAPEGEESKEKARVATDAKQKARIGANGAAEEDESEEEPAAEKKAKR
jgi:hypothetical protein